MNAVNSPPSYKAVLKLNSSNAEVNASAMKKMAVIKNQMGTMVPEFDYKASKNGSIDVLFKSFKDALNVKKMFDEKIENVNVKTPIRKNMKKLDVVGLPFCISKEEAMDAFVKDNPVLGLTLSSDDPCAALVPTNTDLFISVVEVKKCKESPQYRVLFRITEGLVGLLDGLSIKLMSCVLHYYILPDAIQCYKCSNFGHFSDKCKSPEVCAKCSSPSHKTKDCKSKVFKCINCVRNNFPNDNHPAYSHKCPCFK